MSYSLPAGLSVAIMRAIEEAGYELTPKTQPRQAWPAQGHCRMLSPTGVICVLERFHARPHEAIDGYTWEKAGQPRQADPSGAVSSSTTSEQPADPAASPAYCSAKTQWRGTEVVCCQDNGHSEPHESFGGVQW